LIIRMRILETPLFVELQKQQQISPAPVREAIRRHGREILLAAGTRLSENACFYIFSAYVIAYAKDVLKTETGTVLMALNVAAALEFFTIPFFCLLSHRFSRTGLYVTGSGFLLIFAFPYFYLLLTRHPSCNI